MRGREKRINIDDADGPRRATVVNVIGDGVHSVTNDPLLDGVPVFPPGKKLEVRERRRGRGGGEKKKERKQRKKKRKIKKRRQNNAIHHSLLTYH